jgi:hypothetical protein
MTRRLMFPIVDFFPLRAGRDRRKVSPSEALIATGAPDQPGVAPGDDPRLSAPSESADVGGVICRASETLDDIVGTVNAPAQAHP